MKPIGPFLIHLRNQGVLETIRTGAILAIVSVTHYGGDEAEAISSAVKFGSSGGVKIFRRKWHFCSVGAQKCAKTVDRMMGRHGILLSYQRITAGRNAQAQLLVRDYGRKMSLCSELIFRNSSQKQLQIPKSIGGPTAQR